MVHGINSPQNKKKKWLINIFKKYRALLAGNSNYYCFDILSCSSQSGYDSEKEMPTNAIKDKGIFIHFWKE